MESALFLNVFAPCWGEGLREPEGETKQTTKKIPKTFFAFAVFPLPSSLSFPSFFISLFLSPSFFHDFFSRFFSPSLSGFFRFKKSWKSHKTPKICKITRNHPNFWKALKPYKIRGGNKYFTRIRKHYKSRVDKNPWNATRQVKYPSRSWGCIRRGGLIKFLGPKNYIPTPLPWKMPYRPKWGAGYLISPWNALHSTYWSRACRSFKGQHD